MVSDGVPLLEINRMEFAHSALELPVCSAISRWK